jgi:hypothetical protein
MDKVHTTMIPGNKLSSELVSAEFIYPDGEDSTDKTDLERGGIDIGDPSQGLEVQVWEATYVNDDVIVTPRDTGSPQVVFNMAGITELGLAFDHNMNVFIPYVLRGQAWYFWYDPIATEYTHQIMASDVYNPRCCHDDKRIQLVDFSDIILTYQRGTSLYYREERDRYEIEYLLATDVAGDLKSVGMHKEQRLQFAMFSIHDPVNLTALEILDEARQTGWIDQTLLPIVTFEETFGVPVHGDDFTQVIPVGNQIAVTSITDDVRMYVVDSLDASEVIMISIFGNGNVSGSIHYIGYPLPQTAYLPLQKDLPMWIAIASDTGNARIRKQDFSIQETL